MAGWRGIKSTDLSGCTFADTLLRSVDFTSSKNLTQAQIDSAFGVKLGGFGEVKLPPDLDAPDHWHTAAPAQQDNPELQKAYLDDYQKWKTDQGH